MDSWKQKENCLDKVKSKGLTSVQWKALQMGALKELVTCWVDLNQLVSSMECQTVVAS